MMGPSVKIVCQLTLFAGLSLAQLAVAQESNPALDVEAMQKKLGDVQGKNTMPAKVKEGQALKRRDLKGQAMSQSEPEGLTPEQKKMYEEVQQQLQQIKENRAKSDAALEELMKGETGR
jgi:hypothetical protein